MTKQVWVGTAVALTCVMGVMEGASAQTTYKWTGAAGSDWNDSGNWTPTAGPGITHPIAGDTAVLDGTGTGYVLTGTGGAAQIMYTSGYTVSTNLSGAAPTLTATIGGATIGLFGNNTALTGQMVLAGGGSLAISDPGVHLGPGNLRIIDGGTLQLSGTFARDWGTGDGQFTVNGGGGFWCPAGSLTLGAAGGAVIPIRRGEGEDTMDRWRIGDFGASGREVTVLNAFDFRSDVDGESGGDTEPDITLTADLTTFAGGMIDTEQTTTGEWPGVSAPVIWGPGTLALPNAANNNWTGMIVMTGSGGAPGASALRTDATLSNLPMSKLGIWLQNGVLEISGGGTLNGTLGQVDWDTFSGSGGFAAINMDGQYGAAGFAAHNGDATVTLNGGAGLTWGAAYFLSSDITSDAVLKFGSLTSDAQVTLTNAIDLAGGADVYATRQVDVVGGNVAELSGSLTNTGANPAVTLNKTGLGTLILSGSNAWTAGSTMLVTTGQLELASDQGSGSSLVATVAASSDALVTISSASQHLAALNLVGNGAAVIQNSGGSGGKLATVKALSVADDGSGYYTARLDLADNALLIDYAGGSSPLAAVAAMVAQGHAFGGWDGGGIESSQAAVTGYAVGYGDGADGIVPGLGLTEVKAQYCLPGDVNLDGTVDGTDVDFLLGYFGTPSGGLWGTADITYDGTVDGDDVDLFLGYYGSTWPPIVVVASAAASGGALTVPEPGAVLLLAIGALALARRGRGRRA